MLSMFYTVNIFEQSSLIQNVILCDLVKLSHEEMYYHSVTKLSERYIPEKYYAAIHIIEWAQMPKNDLNVVYRY